MRFRLTAGFDAVLHVRDACRETARAVGCAAVPPTPAGGGLELALEAGTYAVFVDAAGEARAGPFELVADVSRLAFGTSVKGLAQMLYGIVVIAVVMKARIGIVDWIIERNLARRAAGKAP